MKQTLKQYFGYDTFREGQEQLISSILTGRDCLCVMPTGAGKSVCFQIPALMMKGITLVISPLISLMKDQVNALSQAGVKAAYINSSLTENQVRLALGNASRGAYKIIYVAPERLETTGFLNFAQNADISMVTVDEAHCVSQWGQDFRPSYLKISPFINTLPKRPVVSAFTATATPAVREDIVNMLGLREPEVLVAGFDRKNLFFDVQKPVDKFAALLAFLDGEIDEPGIVYCNTRKTVEEVCEKLNNTGYKAVRYHAGLDMTERSKNQDDFLFDRIQIIVATNAFGMGIDKSNVRFVVHYNMPLNIEGYYQEAGRAGRDGDPADCLLLYNGQDVQTNLWLLDNAKGTVHPDPITERILRERDHERLKIMTFYCNTNDCLRSYVLKYFGEKPNIYCGNCKNCRTYFDTCDITVEAQKILSCIIKTGERYGIKMIIDTLRGTKTERITRLGLDKLSVYNISELSENRLRDIINYLTLNKYLYITNDRYPVVKRGARAGEVLKRDAHIETKLINESETVYSKHGVKSNQQSKTRSSGKPVNEALFEKLKSLRLLIANEQGVPAFVIFADSTLTDMCVKTPLTDEEFLEVAGVGKVKLERYGKRFIDVIAEFVTT